MKNGTAERGISIHPPHAGRDHTNSDIRPCSIISIHPPHAGRDKRKSKNQNCIAISIHPPHAGRDCRRPGCAADGYDFNPPAPCGAGPSVDRLYSLWFYFNPPAPCGAGRAAGTDADGERKISIHPPRAGRDEGVGAHIISDELFQSTRPVRGGTFSSCPTSASLSLFQSTRPVRGGTMSNFRLLISVVISIHPPRAGRDETWESK